MIKAISEEGLSPQARALLQLLKRAEKEGASRKGKPQKSPVARSNDGSRNKDNTKVGG